MARKRVLSTEEIQEVIKLYESGMSINHLYEKHGYTWSVVKKVLREHGIPLRQHERAKEVTQEEIENIIKLHKEGETPHVIAKKFNRADITIHRILKKYDWETCQPIKKGEKQTCMTVCTASKIAAGLPIDCNTEGGKCYFRAPHGGHLCDYCLITGHSRGCDPHKCTKYEIVEKRGRGKR